MSSLSDISLILRLEVSLKVCAMYLEGCLLFGTHLTF
jgi:hypothetical protein